MRDLGAHLNTAANRSYGATLTARMRTTADGIKYMQMKQAPYKANAYLISAKKLPNALYGCDTAPGNEGALTRLQSAIVDTLTITTTRRSVDLTFAVASQGTDVDPDVVIFKHRVL